MEEIKVEREGGWYVASIPALGIADQGKTLKELRKELKEAVELSIESLLKDELKFSDGKARALQGLLVSSVLDKVDSAISRKYGKRIAAIPTA